MRLVMEQVCNVIFKYEKQIFSYALIPVSLWIIKELEQWEHSTTYAMRT